MPKKKYIYPKGKNYTKNKKKRTYIESLDNELNKKMEKINNDIFNSKGGKKLKIGGEEILKLNTAEKNKIDSYFKVDDRFNPNYMPPNDIILNNEKNRKINFEIYKYLLINNKEKNTFIINKSIFFEENIFIIYNIGEDGNCFFRCISYYFTGEEKFHMSFRKLLYEYIIYKYDEIVAEFPFTYYNGKCIDIDDYIPLIQKNSEYSGELECKIIAKILKINILVVYFEKTSISKNGYKILNFYGDININNLLPLCILEYKEDKKHFDILFFNKEYIEKNTDNKDMSVNNNLKNELDNKSKSIDKGNIINFFDQNKLKSIESSKKNSLEESIEQQKVDIVKKFENLEITNINIDKELEYNKIEPDKFIQTKNEINNVNNNKSNQTTNDKFIPKVNNMNKIMANESISFDKINTEYEKNLFLHKPSDYPIYCII